MLRNKNNPWDVETIQTRYAAFRNCVIYYCHWDKLLLWLQQIFIIVTATVKTEVQFEFDSLMHESPYKKLWEYWPDSVNS